MGKLRTEFTSPIVKSTSSGLLDTTFFACWVHPCHYIYELAISLLSVAENKVLSECLCIYICTVKFSSCFTRKHKEIWSENLVVSHPFISFFCYILYLVLTGKLADALHSNDTRRCTDYLDGWVIHYLKIWHELSWPLDKLMIKLA